MFIFFLILGLSCPVLARNEAGMMFVFGFLNFYTIFLKFSEMDWVGTESVRFFFLILRLSCPILGIDKTRMIFLIF